MTKQALEASYDVDASRGVQATFVPQQILGRNRQVLSPLMQAMRESKGDVINACPFGCTAENLDGFGYCHHLVGFTNDGKTFEPIKLNEHKQRFVHGAEPEQVKRGDRLVQITVSSRVYRDVPKLSEEI